MYFLFSVVLSREKCPHVQLTMPTIRWLGDRQKDMNDALMAGNVGEVARMVVLVNG